MQCITGWAGRQQRWGAVAHTIAGLGPVLLLAMGRVPESLGGWVACPGQGLVVKQARRKRYRRACKEPGCAWRVGLRGLGKNWLLSAVRSEVLLGLVVLTNEWEWDWLCLLPWLAWLWKGIGLAWPRLGRVLLCAELGRFWDWGIAIAILGLGLVWTDQQVVHTMVSGMGLVPVGMGLSVESGKARVKVVQDEAGMYHVQMQGEFVLHVDGTVEVYKRLLVIFLGLLEVPGEQRGSRRTRDGRTPFVRQEQMAEWAGVPHPVISRWFGYWLNQDWRRLLSQRWGEVLTLDIQQRIIDSWAVHPWWTAQAAWQHIRSQGSNIPLNQVKQAGRESGWTALRRKLTSVYGIEPDSFRPRDGWLVSQVLAQKQQLVAQVETLGGLPDEQRVSLADLEALCEELDLHPAEPRRPLPWVLQLEHWLYGHWEWVEDGSVQCIYCGTRDVSRKSRQPRLKKYVDDRGQVQTVEVYRYYCHNPQCPYKTFTHLPPNLLPYSPWTVDHHLAALELYEWSRSVYRCTSQRLGVSKMTAYRWVSGLGYDLLPVAALFGAVRCSGVVGVDEKYVVVPKNDKPDGDMRR